MAVGAVLLYPLYLVDAQFAWWGGVTREIWLLLLCGSLAAPVVVFVMPVLQRGDAVQRLLALVILALPAANLFGSVFGLLNRLL